AGRGLGSRYLGELQSGISWSRGKGVSSGALFLVRAQRHSSILSGLPVHRGLIDAVIAGSLLLGGCEVVSGPGGYSVPEEDVSLDPARARVGPEIYYCGRWNPLVGRPV